MVDVTEGYVEARTGRLKAETQTEIAKALLTLRESARRDLLWTIGSSSASSE